LGPFVILLLGYLAFDALVMSWVGVSLVRRQKHYGFALALLAILALACVFGTPLFLASLHTTSFKDALVNQAGFQLVAVIIAVVAAILALPQA
jgi:hypothetical protein